MKLRIGVFYTLTWFFLILLGGFQQATGLLPPEIGLAQWGPGIAALLMILIFRKDGHKLTFFSKDIPDLRYLYTALIPVGVGLIVFVLKSFLHIQASATPITYDAIWRMIIWMPFGALGEELGWRGYLHKKLNSRMRGLFSSILVGMMWMPIHVAFFGEGAVFLLFLALLIISYAIVIYALVQDTDFNVILASVFHLFINLSNLLFLKVIHETSFMMLNALVWFVVAGIVVVMKKEIFFTSKA